MKNKFTLISILLLSQYLVISQNDPIFKVFRSTHIQKNQKINLQANIETLKDIAVKSDNNHYHLKKGSYDTADSIGIEVNNLKQIISVSFSYNYDTAYVHEQRKYKSLINPKPREYQYTSQTKSIRVTKWEDSETIFELIEIVANGKKVCYSVIFDTELYYKKVKHCIDLKVYNDSSIELLKKLGLFS